MAARPHNAEEPPERSEDPMPKFEQVTDQVTHSLEDGLAEDIVRIDLKGKSSIADTMIIASGRSQRHVGAIADHVVRDLRKGGFGRARVEGLPNCDWVLVDGGDVIVHIFRPEVRDFYNLEKMWTANFPVDRAAV